MEVLAALEKGADRPTQLMTNAKVSWEALQSNLKSLVAADYVAEWERAGRASYTITEKGKDVLIVYRKLVSQHTSDTRSPLDLIGGKVKLRPADDSDFEDFYNWWNDPEFAGEYAGDSPKSRDEVKQLLKDSHSFVIEGRTDGRKIGFISYYLVRSDYLNLYEIGYRVKPSERGKGYTTEAARLLVDHLFTTKPIQRIESVTDTENIPSQRVLEKNGFRREGQLKKRFFLDGDYRDEYIYRLLREEWLESRDA
jgi:RimJ/RimL family protein N-acetyltransferase